MNDRQRNIIIATNIRKYIKENNITQKKLAEEIGIAPSTMSDYMNLRSNPSHGVIQKIADYFQIKKSDIDTTYKEESNNSSIEQIYTKLNKENQKEVYTFAQIKLDEQNNNIVRMPTRDEMTLAAHSADPNKIFTKEEIQKIHDYLDELDAEYDRKHGINKNDDK